jgi:hypothetical protein
MKASADRGRLLQTLNGTIFAGFVLCISNALADPRMPLPPWPQKTSAIYSFDYAYWKAPIRAVAIGEDAATLAESWSGYALVRDTLTTTAPVAIPVVSPDTKPDVSSSFGAVRFWLSVNWTTATEKADGQGPGHYARLLELVNWGGKVPETRWSLYVNKTGDTIYFGGQGATGPTDFVSAPIAFEAGGWALITVCYSETNSALWLNDQWLQAAQAWPRCQRARKRIPACSWAATLPRRTRRKRSSRK